MVPMNEVLIAKIVLGYLSSRNLSGTADTFLKECEGFHSSTLEPGICEKERILNHLEGLNLLPSLEDILKDYFAYQGPDEVANDKVYMLWKQLDVVIGQLRAITMGKTKARAFMTSRRAPRTFNKLVSRTDIINNSINETTFNAMKDLSDSAVTANRPEDTFHSMEKSVVVEQAPLLSVITSPMKQLMKENDKKDFRSPRRKPRHPRHVTTSTAELFLNSNSEVVNETPLNKEFSDLVAALISNDKLSSKLADNINRVVSVETKPPSKFDDIDEIIKLTADDPDLNVLFSMIGGSHTHLATSLPHENINGNSTYVGSVNVTEDSETFDRFLDRNPVTTSTITMLKEANSSNRELLQHSTRPVPFSVETPLCNFLDGILDSQMTDSTSQQVLESKFPGSSNESTSSVSLHLLTGFVKPEVVMAPVGTHSKSPSSQHHHSTVVSSPSLLSTSGCFSPPGILVDDGARKKVDDNVILASHALLQLSTSPLKLSTTSTVENVISRPIVSPQALASNRKTSRELICSTSCLMENSSTLNLNDICDDSPFVSSFLPTMPCSVSQALVSQVNTLPLCYDSKISVAPTDKLSRKKSKRAKKKPNVGKTCITTSIDMSIANIPSMSAISTSVIGSCQCEGEETVQHRKQKRSREVSVTQLDFSSAVSNQTNPINQLDIPSETNTGLEGECVSEVKNSSLPPNVERNLSNRPPSLSPLHSMPKQNAVERNSNIVCKKGSISVLSPKLKPVALESGGQANDPSIKPSCHEFQTFRIKGDAISKVISIDSSENDHSPIKNECSSMKELATYSDGTMSCKSKIRAISMVINNTSSLNRMKDCSTGVAGHPLGCNTSLQGETYGFGGVNNVQCLSKGSPIKATDMNSSYTVIRNNSFIPGGKDGEMYINIDPNFLSSSTPCSSSSFTSVSIKDSEPYLVSSLSSDSQKSEDEIGDLKKKRVRKEGFTSSNRRQVDERKCALRSSKSPLKKMTVKFDFKKSPTRKKRSGAQVTLLDSKKMPGRNLINKPSDSSGDSLSVPKEDESSRLGLELGARNGDLENVPVQTVVQYTASGTNYLTTVDGNSLSSDAKCTGQTLKEEPFHINEDNRDKLDTQVLQKDIPLTHNNEENIGMLHVSSSVTTPLVEKRNINSDISDGDRAKRKGKRKRNISLLMSNVDNVAQLLSGIDYS